MPIIQHLIKVYKTWQEYLPNFPKATKYTLGSKIDSILITTIELIFIASSLPKEQKIPYIQKAISKIDLLKFFLQLSWEIKSLDNKKYIVLSEQLNNIGKMLWGWNKQLIK
ncbi:MAG: four helix bundle protein [bacterium]|nr:four helix bundle protein [bacterium]